jgi:hypothetical protein
MMQVRLIRHPDDPSGWLRCLIGGSKRIGGYYCVFRGDQAEIITMLRSVLTVLEVAPPVVISYDENEY